MHLISLWCFYIQWFDFLSIPIASSTFMAYFIILVEYFSTKVTTIVKDTIAMALKPPWHIVPRPHEKQACLLYGCVAFIAKLAPQALASLPLHGLSHV